MKNEEPTIVQFTVPSFRLHGKEYASADIQQRAQEGDLGAIRIVTELLRIKSGIIKVISNTTSTLTK